MQQEYVFEPLGDQHDRAAFSCGVEPLDRYLKQQARQDIKRYLAAVFVLRSSDAPMTILGYYTLSATSIDPGELPQHLTKRLPPSYRALPAVLIGRLAVDQRSRGQGHGERLLLDALYRSFHNDIAALTVVVDAKDDSARAFYEHFGFQRIIDQEYRLYLPMSDIKQLFSE